MKRWICAVLMAVLVFSLTACGDAKAKEPVDLNTVYESLKSQMPEMLPLDETMMLNLFGIEAADCEQAITAICADSMSADEVWLVRAKDKAALEKIDALAQTRLKAKAEECESYAPDQYAIVLKGELVKSDLYLALLVGPESAAMKATVEAALK